MYASCRFLVFGALLLCELSSGISVKKPENEPFHFTLDFSESTRVPRPCGRTLARVYQDWYPLFSGPRPPLQKAEALFKAIRKAYPKSRAFFKILKYVHVPGVDLPALRINLRESGFEAADFRQSLSRYSDTPARLFRRLFETQLKREPEIAIQFRREIDDFLEQMSVSLASFEELPDAKEQVFCFFFRSQRHDGFAIIDQGTGISIAFGIAK